MTPKPDPGVLENSRPTARGARRSVSVKTDSATRLLVIRKRLAQAWQAGAA